MRTVDEIRKDFEASKKGDEIIQVGKNVYEFRNEGIRRKLRDEYVATLTEDKQLAVWLHKTMCKEDHSAVCGFLCEMKNDFEDDWGQSTHARYLKCAKALLGICSNTDLVKKLILTARHVDNM